MRALAWAVTAVALAAGATIALAQDANNPEQLKKLYDDALAQLKAAQDRKNELATQNEQLTAKVAELQKQLDQARGEMLELKRQDAENAEKELLPPQPPRRLADLHRALPGAEVAVEAVPGKGRAGGQQRAAQAARPGVAAHEDGVTHAGRRSGSL
jgi:hypothetical protein